MSIYEDPEKKLSRKGREIIFFVGFVSKLSLSLSLCKKNFFNLKKKK